MAVFVSPSADKQAVLAAAKLALLDAGFEQSCIQARAYAWRRVAAQHGGDAWRRVAAVFQLLLSALLRTA